MASSSQWIDIPADKPGFSGYLALPRTGKGPGILLLQEIFGVNEHIRRLADQYAAEGYVVLAPDVFWRNHPKLDVGYDDASRNQGIELMKKTDLAEATADNAAAVKALRARPELVGKVTAIGYCFGGRLAYLAAADGSVDAAVSFYGGGIQTQLDKVSNVKVPMLFHYGEKDHGIPLDAVDQVKAAFKGKDAAFHVYPGAEHGFNCDFRPSYHRHASALSHGRTLQFLEEKVNG